MSKWYSSKWVKTLVIAGIITLGTATTLNRPDSINIKGSLENQVINSKERLKARQGDIVKLKLQSFDKDGIVSEELYVGGMLNEKKIHDKKRYISRTKELDTKDMHLRYHYISYYVKDSQGDVQSDYILLEIKDSDIMNHEY
ncbi:hypothetical protein GOV14_03270 [Candidatus Pacearchaeota archaeon]|nr:hypothetical protein [Candidatus Pacearchaeota archaeon]